MKFSVIVPNFTGKKEKLSILETCLDSFTKFHKNDPLLKEIIVSDDASPLELRPSIAEIAKKYNARLVQKETNGGYAKNANAGLAAASSDTDVVLMVNNDVVFTGPVLAILAQDFAADPALGIVGALIFYPDGSIQHAGVKRNGFQFSHIGWKKQIENFPELNHPKYMLAVVGAIEAIRKKMLDEIGAFDETLLISREDTQICIRAWLKNWKVLYQPRFQVTHLEGATRGSSLLDKLFRNVQTRKWLMAEFRTEAMFMNWLRTIDLKALDQKIEAANASLNTARAPHHQVYALNRISFRPTQWLRRALAYIKSRLFYWLSKYV